MDAVVLATVAIAFFCGGVIKGVIGLGLPLTAIALMTIVLDIRIAVPLLVVPIITTNIVQAFRGNRFRALTARFWSLVLASVACVYAGVYILYRVDTAYLLATMGLVVAAYALINLFAIRLSLPQRSEKVLSPLVGIASGLLSGTTGTIGVPVIIYFQALGLSKDEFVQALGIQFLITGSVLTLALFSEGGIDLPTAQISTLALVPAFAGMYAGQYLRERISEEKFRTWVFAFLVIVGLNLIRKGFF